MVVSAISSGLANIVFMRPGATVVEIFPRSFFMHVDWAVCDLVGLRYFYMWEDGVQPDAIPEPNRFADVTIDIAVLEKTLALAARG